MTYPANWQDKWRGDWPIQPTDKTNDKSTDRLMTCLCHDICFNTTHACSSVPCLNLQVLFEHQRSIILHYQWKKDINHWPATSNASGLSNRAKWQILRRQDNHMPHGKWKACQTPNTAKYLTACLPTQSAIPLSLSVTEELRTGHFSKTKHSQSQGGRGGKYGPHTGVYSGYITY